MIEIGTGFLNALSAAKQTRRTQKDRYHALMTQAEDQAQALREQYAQRTAYLFRTSAEKTRQAYDTARTQLASRQAKWAAQGITAASSAATVAQQVKEQAQLSALSAQQQLQTQAADQEKTTRSALQKLADAWATYRRAATKKGRLGSLGAAFSSLFH